MVISFFEDIFPYEKFPVEYECFKQIKNTNLNYIAVPWTQILNSHWLDYPNKKNKEFYFKTLSKFKVEQQDNITVCQHDSYLSLENYFKHLKINKVFTPLRETTDRTIEGITFIPIPFTCDFSFSFTSKDILFSFIGSYTTHPLRERMKTRINGDNIIYRNNYHVCTEMFFNNDVKKQEENEYREMLERSKFSLCPRGSSCSSVRFWESIQAGTIPVLISDCWLLPDWDWKNTIIQIKENEFETMNYNDIEKILLSIPSSRVLELQANCLQAAKHFSQNNFLNYIKNKIL